jgi:hypothetical protein
MEFFNKKEEVLEVQLTEYGKYLFSIGSMKPTFYAFFDDDILYDVSGSGFSEGQNEAEGRIQSNTPKLKIISTRTSAEDRVERFLNAVSLNSNSDPASAESVATFNQQSFGDKGKVNAYPIGNSSLSSGYNAAWKVELLSMPELSSSARYINNGGLIENIPQLNIDIDYEIFFRQGDMADDSISGYFGESDLFLSMNENYLMLEVIETNTDFEKENFEIEVYLSGTTEYSQLSYVAESETQFIMPTTSNIEYHMNILVDNEIPEEVIKELNISPKALTTNASRLKLNRNLYSTEDEEPC